ncbi:PEP-CTERM sorting domain-containing protein [Cognatazoarcus halotolerans]|uniref:PEP-CTERM sorting domain-containing protein n=1 Tax=Cognatazoarcus halotolerans TaxID=2686016 RepID=UPI001356BFE6|nr:PEP-CTERM sorting domain-containing protein [Cognatazoarcus halotolerans]MBX3680376.1 hypothetical protein [Rhodocyclaceae bacterium]MCB1898619.1 hypothetical protein [Rhodocyclaceae bacterium]MCP5310854.1 hypothetical protein [Zoogloeaceae bacterium]
MKMKPLAWAVSLAALTATANVHATVFSSFGGTHDSTESGSEILFASGPLKGVFEFVLDVPSIVSYKGASTLPFLGFGLFDTGDTMLSGALFSPTTGASLTSVTLAAGSYYYAPVFPAAVGAGAAYAFESHAAMVPEAESYAYMLAGLGMLGMVAFRRTSGRK